MSAAVLVNLCMDGGSRSAQRLERIAAAMLESEPPWVRSALLAESDIDQLWNVWGGAVATNHTDWRPEHLFAAACTLCAFAEVFPYFWDHQSSFLPQGIGDLSMAVVTARMGSSKRSRTTLLDRWSLTPEQQDLLWRWMWSEVSFCKAAEAGALELGGDRL